jgi:hypothetical protein
LPPLGEGFQQFLQQHPQPPAPAPPPPDRRGDVLSPQRTALAQPPRRRVRRLLMDGEGNFTGLEETEEAAPPQT